MCLCKNEKLTWRSKCMITAALEIVWGIIGTILMILTLRAYFKAKATPPPADGSYQDFQGLEGFAMSMGKTMIVAFLVIHPLVPLVLGIPLLVATKESLAESKPKLCYMMVCTWSILALANVIFNFVACFYVGDAIFFPLILLFAHALFCFPIPFYASILYKKIHRPYQTMTITHLGDLEEDRDPEVPLHSLKDQAILLMGMGAY